MESRAIAMRRADSVIGNGSRLIAAELVATTSIEALSTPSASRPKGFLP